MRWEEESVGEMVILLSVTFPSTELCVIELSQCSSGPTIITLIGGPEILNVRMNNSLEMILLRRPHSTEETS